MWNWMLCLAEREAAGEPCVLATLSASAGSAPAPPGAKLVLAADGRSWGTVGGGALEAEVLRRMRELLGSGRVETLRLPLVEQGQCCGGMVELVLESLFDGPCLHVLGAGHVGQELAAVLAGTRLAVRLVDDRPEWIQRPQPAGVQAREMAPRTYVEELRPGPRDLALILTHSHELDLELLRKLADHPPAWTGVIGSRNKWRSFRERLVADGVSPAWLDTVACPVGDSRVGKSPREVAIALAREALLAEALLDGGAQDKGSGGCPSTCQR